MLRKHTNVVTLALVGVLAATGLSACKTAQKDNFAGLEVTIDDFIASGYVTDASGRSLASVGVLVRLFREVSLVKKGVSEAVAQNELLGHLNAQLAKSTDTELVAFRKQHKSITKENYTLIPESAQARLAKAVIKEGYANSPALSGASKEADAVLASVVKSGGAETAAKRGSRTAVKRQSPVDAVASVYSRGEAEQFLANVGKLVKEDPSLREPANRLLRNTIEYHGLTGRRLIQEGGGCDIVTADAGILRTVSEDLVTPIVADVKAFPQEGGKVAARCDLAALEGFHALNLQQTKLGRAGASGEAAALEMSRGCPILAKDVGPALQKLIASSKKTGKVRKPACN